LNYLRDAAIVSEDLIIIDSRLLAQLQRKHICQYWPYT